MQFWGRQLFALIAFLMGALGFSAALFSHALQPGYLELRLIDKDIYAVVWKVPATSGRPMAIAAQLPQQCEPRTPGQPIWDGAAYVTRWTANCPGGLEGGVIHIDGLDRTSTDVLVRFDSADGVNQAHRLTASDPSFTVPIQPGTLDVVQTYFLFGVEHILSGFDHLLFVFALLLIVNGVRRLLITITAFTLAHSVTLATAALGILWVPSPPVEATIALSILFLASELVKLNRGEPGLTATYPWLVALTFGLLHGLGFAGALAEVGLPQHEIPLALLMFNVGVELGQLLFIAAILALIFVLHRLRGSWPAWSRQVPAYGIGSMAAFWFVERVSGF